MRPGWTLTAVLGAVACGAPGGAAAPRPATASAANNPLRSTAIAACVRPRLARGIPAYTVDGTRLPFTVATGHEPGTRPRCPDGDLRILRLAAVRVAGALAYVRRGGCQEPCVVREPTVLVLARDLTRPVALLPRAARGGDGARAPGCRRTVAYAPQRVADDLGRMYYKTPADLRSTGRRSGIVGAGARWSNYGDPGRRFRTPAGTHADYGYLLWNLPRRSSGGLLPGGGIVEAPVAAGAPVALCAVAPVRLPSFDVRGAPNGEVVFGYARTVGRAALYGWMLIAYRYRDGPTRTLT